MPIVFERDGKAIKSGAVLILASLMLTACATQQERAAKHAAAEQAAGVDRASRCVGFGYKLGTPDYRHCLENMYVQDQQKVAAEEARRRAQMEDAGEAMQRAGAALQSISPPPPPMVTCHTFGNTTTCQ